MDSGGIWYLEVMAKSETKTPTKIPRKEIMEDKRRRKTNKSKVKELLQKQIVVESSGKAPKGSPKNKKEEYPSGEVRFEVLNASRTRSEVDLWTQTVWLEQLVHIFEQQLPVMYAADKSYISRTVLSREHRSMVLLISDKVYGGVTFRTWKQKHFMEIAFFAVSSILHGQGYGTILMNHLKQMAQSEGIRYFLTYADNTAIGFFRKQGFSDKITFDSTKWKRFIKYYTEATLMQFDVEYDIVIEEEQHDWNPCTVCGLNDVTPFMICCDHCESWCHGECVNMKKTHIKGEWYCPMCRITDGLGSL